MSAEIRALATWQSLETGGRLELYLLGNKQNYPEALMDQGGTRQWSARCCLRKRQGPFDDVALYRFACGCNYPAELVDPAQLEDTRAWLSIEDADGVIPLGAARDGETTSVAFYNTLQERASLSLAGRAVENRVVERADMLGRVQAECPNGSVEIEPLAYAKVIIRRR